MATLISATRFRWFFTAICTPIKKFVFDLTSSFFELYEILLEIIEIIINPKNGSVVSSFYWLISTHINLFGPTMRVSPACISRNHSDVIRIKIKLFAVFWFMYLGVAHCSFSLLALFISFRYFFAFKFLCRIHRININNIELSARVADNVLARLQCLLWMCKYNTIYSLSPFECHVIWPRASNIIFFHQHTHHNVNIGRAM